MEEMTASNKGTLNSERDADDLEQEGRIAGHDLK